MKRMLKNITDSLADAAMLEVGVEVPAVPHATLWATAKRFSENFSVTMADAAMLEMGAYPARAEEKRVKDRETLEENLIEVAFAEAADYDDIHDAIMREHHTEEDRVHLDECQYGDNDVCFA